MQRLLGLWVWALLLRRLLLSVLSELYTIASIPCPKVLRCLAEPQRLELTALLGLAPLIFRNLRRLVSKRFYATDASPWGAGVIYADLAGDSVGAPFLSIFRGARVVAGWYAIPRAVVGVLQWSLRTHIYDATPPPIHPLASAWSSVPLITEWSNLVWKTAIEHRWRKHPEFFISTCWKWKL